MRSGIVYNWNGRNVEQSELVNSFQLTSSRGGAYKIESQGMYERRGRGESEVDKTRECKESQGSEIGKEEQSDWFRW